MNSLHHLITTDWTTSLPAQYGVAPLCDSAQHSRQLCARPRSTLQRSNAKTVDRELLLMESTDPNDRRKNPCAQR